MTKQLTTRQTEVLEFIKDFIKEHNYPPTIREIADHMGYKSSGNTFALVNALVEKGYITKSDRGPRTIQLVDGLTQTTFPKMNDVQLKFFIKDTIMSTLEQYGVKGKVNQVSIEETAVGKKGYIGLVIDLDNERK